MRLLRAELVKLRRPLLWWTVLALLMLVGLIGWAGVRAAVDWYANNQFLAEHPPSCADLGLREGPECEAEKANHQAMVEQERGRTEQELRLARALQHPVGVGVLAAGMLASFPGAVALLLLAAAMSVTSGAVGQSSRC